jgi:hypothetical protein
MTALRSRTHLTGIWLICARAVWMLLAVVYIGAFFIVALPAWFTQPDIPVIGWPDWTAEDARFALAALGWSVQTYVSVLAWSNLLPLVYFVLGAFIFWRRSDDWMALLVSLTFIAALSTTTTDALARINPAWDVIGSVNDSFTSVLLIIIFYLFPDGRFVPRWTRWAALIVAVIQFFRIVRPELYDRGFLILIVPFLGSMLAAQVYRYSRVSDPVQRRQTKWVVFGLVVGLLPLVTYLTIIFSIPELREPGALGMIVLLLGNLLWTSFLVVLPVSFTIAMLRAGLWDIDLIIRRTLIYTVLTVILALVYLGSVVMLQRLMTPLIGRESPLAIVASTLAIAALFQPLRRRIQNVIDRRFYRRKYDSQRVLESFAARLRNETDLDAMTHDMVQVVQETLQPTHASLWLREPSRNPTEARP